MSIYLASNGKAYKIGMVSAQTVQQRIKGLRFKCTYKDDKFKLIDSFETGFNPKTLEILFCELNYDCRIFSEYFFCTDETLIRYGFLKIFFNKTKNFRYLNIIEKIKSFKDYKNQGDYIENFIDLYKNNIGGLPSLRDNLSKILERHIEKAKTKNLAFAYELLAPVKII